MFWHFNFYAGTVESDHNLAVQYVNVDADPSLSIYGYDEMKITRMRVPLNKI